MPVCSDDLDEIQATFLETQAAAALEAAEAVAEAELAAATGDGEPDAKLRPRLTMSSMAQATLSRGGTGRSEALKAALLRTASTSSSAYLLEVRVPSYALTYTCAWSAFLAVRGPCKCTAGT